MKFKLIEDWDRLEEKSTAQSRINKSIRKKYFPEDLWREYQVHHLNGELVDNIKKIKNNELTNLIFVRKGMGAAIDDLHRIIHLVAKCGSVDAFIDLLKSLDAESDKFIKISLNEDGSVNKIFTTLSEVAKATIEKSINVSD